MQGKIILKMKFAPGVTGIPIAKLAAQMEKMANIAESVARDLGISAPISEWKAEKFRNSSLAYDMICETAVSEDDNANFAKTLNTVLDFNPQKNTTFSNISNQTVSHVLAFAQTFAKEERAVIAFPKPGGKRPKLVPITRERLERVNHIIKSRNEISEYEGSVVGYLHEWNIGAKLPFIKIRDVGTSDLIKCSYDSDIEKKTILQLFEASDQLIIVYGTIFCDPETGKLEIKKATGFELTPKFDMELYKVFPGMCPDITGGIGAVEYVRGLRGGN